MRDFDGVIIEAETAPQRQQARAIRRAVFVEEQGIPAALDADGRDGEARHVLALDGARPAATGRLVVEADGSGTLARIAVLPAYRGQGLGRRIVERLEALARQAGCRTVRLHAHAHLEPFYAGMAYRTHPEEIEAAGYRLVTMIKAL